MTTGEPAFPQSSSPRVVPRIAHATVSSAASIGFAAAPALPTGFLPTAVVSDDFNQDGKPDLAVSNGGDNTIYVYPGKGDGTFGVPQILYTSGRSPVWLTSAKLRQGGHLDLITVDGDSEQVEVFSGNGDGTFQPASVVATLPQAPTFVLSADFNHDGTADLAIGFVLRPYTTGAQFAVLPGNGSGGFSAAIPGPSFNNASSDPLVTNWLAAGDLNGDSYPDLVVTVAFVEAFSFLNQGGTSFQPGVAFSPANAPVAVALADLNNDACLDAVQTDAAGFLTVATGNCNGTFSQHQPAAALGDVDVAIVVADINGDGKPDVVASSAFSDVEAPFGLLPGAYGGYLVSVLYGDGAGGFAPATLYRVGSQAYSLAVADFTGTGKPDIVTVSQQESTASRLANDGNGGFGSPRGQTIGYLGGVWNAPIPGTLPQTIDLNGDGKLDVLLLEYGQNSIAPSAMTALLNQGNQTFSAPVRTPITVGPKNPMAVFVAGNFRNASVADVVYVDQNTSANVAAMMAGNGDGSFAAPVTLGALPNPSQIVGGDFNHDGKLDFAVWGYMTAGNSNMEELDIFLGNGDGSFRQLPAQTFAPLSSAMPQQLIAGDFNHDGKVDLLIGHNTNSGWVDSGDDLDLAIGNGDGTFQPIVTLVAHFGPVAVADLNHDGLIDLIQARDPAAANVTQQALNAAGGPFIAPAVTIYLGAPNGKFTQQATYHAPGIQLPSYSPALAGDFNGDGNLDVVLPYVPATIGRPWERRLQLFQGMGDGTFATNGIPFQLPAYDQPVIGGDYRGGGSTDLLDLVGATSSINWISSAPSPVLAITPSTIPLAATQGSATVTLALPAASNQTVQLTASDPAVELPAGLSFGPGEQQQGFSFTVGAGFDSSHLLAINGTLDAQTITAFVAAQPNPNAIATVTASIGGSTSGTASVATSPGSPLALLFTLASVNGYSGTFSNFSCAGLPSATSCDFTASSLTLLPGGYAQVAFTLNVGAGAPPGNFTLSVGASNGEVSPSVPLTLGIGGFTLALNPSLVPVNADPAPVTTVSANFTNGYNQSIQLTCSGLPAGVTCNIPSVLYPGAPSTPVSVNVPPSLAAQDYPFSISGTAGSLSSTANAILRVSNYTASLQTDTASLASGQSATFNVQLVSVNHFSNGNISVSCQAPSKVTCTTATQYATLGDDASVSIPLTVKYQPVSSSSRPKAVLTWLPALLIPLLLTPFQRRKGWGRVLLFALIGWVAAGAAFTGCGGGASGTGGAAPPPATQTLSIPVTVQANTGSDMVQQSAGTIVLTVH